MNVIAISSITNDKNERFFSFERLFKRGSEYYWTLYSSYEEGSIGDDLPVFYFFRKSCKCVDIPFRKKDLRFLVTKKRILSKVRKTNDYFLF